MGVVPVVVVRRRRPSSARVLIQKHPEELSTAAWTSMATTGTSPAETETETEAEAEAEAAAAAAACVGRTVAAALVVVAAQ